MIFRTWICIIFIFLSTKGICNHIIGGEMYLISHSSLLNVNGDFTIGLDLYSNCGNGLDSSSLVSLFPSPISIAVYSNTTGKLYFSNSTIKLVSVKSISGGKLPDCVVNAGLNCYSKATYTFYVKIPYDPNGYTAVFESCCRTSNTANIFGNQGYTITYKIVETNTPYTAVTYFADNNNNIVCANSQFSISLLTKVPVLSNIQFSYHLTPAYGSVVSIENQTALYKGEPFVPLLYDSIQNYSGYFPLGRNVTIDTLTGIVSGIAPNPGDYLINVLINEYIDGSIIAFTKQFILKVRSCRLDAARLDSIRLACDNLNVSFANLSTNTDITSYQWQFLRNNAVVGSATSSSPNFKFADTGTYTIRLTVVNTAGCQDSASQQLRLYPFLKAGFTIQGNCAQQPYVFTDTSTTTFGFINSRRWDFGDTTTTTDTSVMKSPAYQYGAQGTKTVQLTITNTIGCVGTVKKALVVSGKPALQLSTHDTLICSIDTLKLQANGQGTVSWSPSYNIIGSQSSSPSVFPKQSTKYIATLNAGSCVNTDTVTVNVLDYISVDAGADISICKGDSVRINPVSKALSYLWSPASGLSAVTDKSPLAFPASTSQYIVTANLGKCQAKDTVLINVYPYPIVNAGNDTIICNGTKAFLHGLVNTSSYYWSPSSTLSNTGILNPLSIPTATTSYILTGFEQQGCTRAVSDTVVVTVIPATTVYAGRDTSVVIGQPLQLHASGGNGYLWSPTTGLSDPTIADPIAILNGAVDLVRYIVTATSGVCQAQDDIIIKVYKSKPDIYVPSAFTPNHDGRNDYLRAIPIGIKTFLGFDIYGRWGGLLFHTTDPSQAWDGRVRGNDQSNGTYVYVARGIDYLGNYIEKSGTVTIIR